MSNVFYSNSNQDHYLTLQEVLRIIPVGKSTWWAGIKKGRYPAPYKISARRSAWKHSEIERLMETIEEQNR